MANSLTEPISHPLSLPTPLFSTHSLDPSISQSRPLSDTQISTHSLTQSVSLGTSSDALTSRHNQSAIVVVASLHVIASSLRFKSLCLLSLSRPRRLSSTTRRLLSTTIYCSLACLRNRFHFCSLLGARCSNSSLAVRRSNRCLLVINGTLRYAGRDSPLAAALA